MLRCAYLDLDGTVTGWGGSLFHDEDGNVSLMAARGLEAAHRAGVEIVPISGRRRDTVREPARAMGATSYGFEIGGGLVVDGEDYWQTGELEPSGEESVFDLIMGRGVLELLTAQFPDRLELHSPWHTGREVTLLLRGEVDADQAQRLLDEHGSSDLRFVDNGFLGGLPKGGTGTSFGGDVTGLDPSIDAPRSYHVTPRGVSKAAAVERHRQLRGYEREETIAVGDSAEDLGMADATDTFWLVGGAAERDSSVLAALSRYPNVQVADGGPGAAVYEAIVTTLMTAREP